MSRLFADAVVAPGTLSQIFQLVGQFAAIRGEIHHDLLMKPNVHRGRVTRITAVMKFLCEFLARSKTAVQGKKLHEIDDGVLPIELLRCIIVQGVEHSGDVDRWSGASMLPMAEPASRRARRRLLSCRPEQKARPGQSQRGKWASCPISLT